MASLDDIVNVRISLNTAGVGRADFGTVLILVPDPSRTWGARKVRTFSSYTEAVSAGLQGVSLQAVETAFAQDPKPRRVKVAIYTDGSPQEMQAILDEDNDWYACCPVAEKYRDDIFENISRFIETQKKICVLGTTDVQHNMTYFVQLAQKQRFRTAMIYGDINAGVAWAAKCLNYPAGSETWALKRLSSVDAAELPTVTRDSFIKDNISTVERYARGIVLTFEGKTLGGEWIDVIRFRDWLENNIQINLINLLINSPKIPYTDHGLQIIGTNIKASLEEGRAAGGIAEDEENANGDILPGYLVEIPRSLDISPNTKASREVTIKFRARLAGAIHTVEILGSFTYENA